MGSNVLNNAIIKKYGTREKFAKRVGTNAKYVSRAVTGKRKLTNKIRKRWARILGIHPVRIRNDDRR